MMSGLITLGRKWTKPSRGWFKLNTDASVFPQIGHATAGGLIRDQDGQWIVGFTARLNLYCDSTTAELLALREGLRLARERGIKKVEIETDSQAAFILIQKPDLELDIHRLGSMVKDCRKVLKRNWQTKFSHVNRGRNKCADALAKQGKHQNGRSIIWKTPPDNVRDLVSNEKTS